MKAIILAGGKGKRLAPYTTVLPKPLMPIGEYPIIEILIRQLSHHQVKDITIATGYLGQLIEAYCGDGSRWGVNIKYSQETAPLGTAGPLTLVDGFDETVIVMNGDLLTDLDFQKLYEFHMDNNPAVTIGMYKRTEEISLGVLKTDGANKIVDYLEKPKNDYLVSMGIYIVEPIILSHMEPGKYCDFPDLIMQLINSGETVVGYEGASSWLDIGRVDDYKKAVELFETSDEFVSKLKM